MGEVDGLIRTHTQAHTHLISSHTPLHVFYLHNHHLHQYAPPPSHTIPPLSIPPHHPTNSHLYVPTHLHTLTPSHTYTHTHSLTHSLIARGCRGPRCGCPSCERKIRHQSRGCVCVWKRACVGEGVRGRGWGGGMRVCVYG